MKTARRIAVPVLLTAALAGCSASPTYEATIYRSEGAGDCRGEGWRRYVEPAFRDAQQCRRYFDALNAQRLRGFVPGGAQRPRLEASPASR